MAFTLVASLACAAGVWHPLRRLDLALGSLSREKEVSSSMARERDEHLAQQRHAAGRAHLLMEENKR